MTIFHLLPLAGLVFGIVGGATLGSTWGSIAGLVAAIGGGIVGFIAGQIPFVLVARSIQRDFSTRTVAELRAMLRDPGCLAPNAVLIELGSRGEDLEPELPVVLDMLASSSSDRRKCGWHALASAFPERAKLIADYRIDDALEECQRKIRRLTAGIIAVNDR